MKFGDFPRHCRIATPLGGMLLAATARGLAGAWFTHGQHDLPDSAAWGDAAPDDALLQTAARQIEEYFERRRRDFDLPIDLQSTSTGFQQAVWRALLDIRWGETRSYGFVAAAVDRPRAVRAVGAAVGRNPISVIVPCHRVIGASGSLTGYGGGLDRKIALLALEGRTARDGRCDPRAAQQIIAA